MSTEELEKVAMAKTYNVHLSDELQEKKETEVSSNHHFDEVTEILSRHQIHQDIWKEFCESDFSYLHVEDADWKIHLIKILDGEYGLLLDNRYILDYSSSLSNSKLFGAFAFRDTKEFLLEYRKASLEEFNKQMEDLKDVFKIADAFHTERNQIFIEYEDDAIYCYQEGYIFRLSGYDRNIIDEYINMYLTLMSFTVLKDKKYESTDLLKYVYFLSKHALEYLYKGIDLRKVEVSQLMNQEWKEQDVVEISLAHNRYYEVLDVDYYVAQRKKQYRKEDYRELSIYHRDNWEFEGSFPLGILGTYEKGEFYQYSEIFASTEMSDAEKKELLLSVLKEKQQECIEKQSMIENQCLWYYFQDCLEDVKHYWLTNRWIDFLKVEKLPLSILSFENIQNWVMDQMEQIKKEEISHPEGGQAWQNWKQYIDTSSFRAKIQPCYLTVSPSFLLIECVLFGKEKNFVITEKFEVIEWTS